MCKDIEFLQTAKKGSSLDTLALPTPSSNNGGPSPSKLAYIKRQRAKAITMSQIFPLIDLKSPLSKSYWSTYHCNREIIQVDNTLTTQYCNARWCIVCNRVRMAKMINSYSIPLLTLPDIYFVTLTAPNVGVSDLKDEIKRFFSTWVKMRKSINKYSDIVLKGMRKFECTYNPNTHYNPHFHIIISGKDAANLILDKWMHHNPKSSISAQDIRKANDGSLVELFKYAAKGIHKGKFYPYHIDQLYQCMYGRKTYYPLGIKKMVEEDISGIESQEVDFLDSQTTKFTWVKDLNEWYDTNGHSLTDYAIRGDVFDLVDHIED